MEFETFSDMQAPDPRGLVFTPRGLGGPMSPEAAAEFRHKAVTRFELAPDVSEETRLRFEQVQRIYSYGLLCYDLYTAASDAALLVLEQALRDRFVSFHNGLITFRTPRGVEHTVPADRYNHFLDRYKAEKGNEVKTGPSGEWVKFGGGMLHSLKTWARHVGLLQGQRNRGMEKMLSELRNAVAHPNGFTLLSPIEATQRIWDLAEIINHLWGHKTPGGRLYPAGLPQRVCWLGWDPRTGNIAAGDAENLQGFRDDSDFEFIVLRTVHEPGGISDPHLFEFDSWYEATQYPTELLWGPGSKAEAVDWLANESPEDSTCHYLDRIFLVRQHAGRAFLPMRPEVAAGLPAEEQDGVWHVLRADYPTDAFVHARYLNGSPKHDTSGECSECWVTALGQGDLAEALQVAEKAGASVVPVSPPDFRTPLAFPRSQPLT
ncbi:hypothetical protein AB0K51_09280 [Kitasatospora sp. NPDC049285]|uniref:hypothetical protein n=1 Tax=Kitasatospora sp. NPDC049285 TaxID=3157096 RepID=UPI00341AB3E4